jgi:hypothetical protein
MENKSKKRILIGALIVLILMNLAALGTFTFKKYFDHHHREKQWNNDQMQHKDPHDRIKQYVKNELQLSDEQFKKFCDLKDLNKKNTDEIWLHINKLMEATQLEITNEKPDSLKLNSLVDSIGEYHKKMQMEMNRHFFAVKKILKPDQISKFNEMILNLGKRDWKGHGESRKKMDTCKPKNCKK